MGGFLRSCSTYPHVFCGSKLKGSTWRFLFHRLQVDGRALAPVVGRRPRCRRAPLPHVRSCTAAPFWGRLPAQFGSRWRPLKLPQLRGEVALLEVSQRNVEQGSTPCPAPRGAGAFFFLHHFGPHWMSRCYHSCVVIKSVACVKMFYSSSRARVIQEIRRQIEIHKYIHHIGEPTRTHGLVPGLWKRGGGRRNECVFIW